MSKEEIVRVAVPKKIFDIATRLGTVRVGDVNIHLHTEAMIIKEAVARGLRLMVIEDMVSNEIAERYARKNAKRICTSLITRTADGTSEAAVNMREALVPLKELEVVEEEKDEDVDTEEEEDE